MNKYIEKRKRNVNINKCIMRLIFQAIIIDYPVG